MGVFPNADRLDYSAYWHARGFALQKKLREREVIIAALIPAGARVLDIGCGNSRLPLVLKEQGCEVTVADISPVVLEAFASYDIPGFELDLDQISTKRITDSYDFIILSEVLEHTRNPEEILHTLGQHTKRFALTIPNTAFYPFRFRLFFKGRFPKQWVHHPSEHLRFWSHRDFLDWLFALGFTIERIEPSNGFSAKGILPFAKNIWPNLLAHQIVYICHP